MISHFGYQGTEEKKKGKKKWVGGDHMEGNFLHMLRTHKPENYED